MGWDAEDKLVFNQEMNGKTIIDSSNLSTSIYNINITNSDGVVNKRLIVAK